MAGYHLPFDLFARQALSSNLEAIPTKGEGMQTPTLNGSAEHRVAQALQEEVIRKPARISWVMIAETVLILVGIGALVWSLFR